MRRLHAQGYNAADALLRGLVNFDWYAKPGMRVLDFGCGSGERVYQLRDLGYDAYGFDMIDVVNLRRPEDRAFFAALEGPRGGVGDTRVSDEAMRVPFESRSFDFIFSETVIEHCYALDGMMRECARLLKADGFSVHTFPTRNSVIEPHMFVPFAGRIQSDWWLQLWARLGVRNGSQRTMTARETVAHNRLYLESGLCYRPGAEVATIAARHFRTVENQTRSFHSDDPIARRVQRYAKAIFSRRPFEAMAPLQKLRVLAAREPR